MFSLSRSVRFTSLSLLLALTLSACGGGDAGNSGKSGVGKKELALEKIMAFAESEGNAKPTVQDYIDAGVSGVTPEKLAELNKLVSGLEPADVDSTSELDSLTSQISINIKPTADAGSDKSVQVNIGLPLVGGGTDPDGSIVKYVWKKGDAVLSSSQNYIYTPKTIGTHSLTLVVTDDDGATASDEITITATTPPTTANKAPTANAGSNKSVEANKSIMLNGTGSDSDGEIIGYEWKKGDVVISSKASFLYTPTKVGKDTLTLTVKDNGGLFASSSVEITVTPSTAPDTTPPTILVLGDNPVSIEQGTSYSDAGATATDDKDGNITASIKKSGDIVNTSADIGAIFTIHYNVSDAAGNIASEVTRTVKIIAVIPDTIDPVITLLGSSTIEVLQGVTYTDAGATATDNKDGNITGEIVKAGDTVNTSATVGTTFTITYNVKDKANNSAIEVTRSVSVIANSHLIPALSTSQIQAYLDVINAARAEARVCGGYGNKPAVSPVSWSDQLYRAAYEHSQDLAESNTFDHLGSGTVSDWTGFGVGKQSKVQDRINAYAYSWSRISENISAGTNWDTAQEAVDSWLSSPGHCINVMDANVTQVGLALYINASSTYTHYWTQNFGHP